MKRITTGVPLMCTFTGTYFDFANPKRETIHIEDIARALSNICRFNGHTKEFYSVAQHSVLVSEACNPEDALHGLLHDASEAYLGDVVTSLKDMLPSYKVLEADLQSAIYRCFGLDPEMPASVKYADLSLLAAERRDLMNHGGYSWSVLDGVEPIGHLIEPLLPKQAYNLFINRYFEILQS